MFGLSQGSAVHQEAKIALERLVETALTSLRSKQFQEDNGLKVEAGYPKVAEVEFVVNEPGAKPQPKHQDTRFNIVTLITGLGRGKPTWVATQSSMLDPSGRIKERLGVPKYEVLKPAASDRHYSLLNHGAWPHGGPGNQGSKETRRVIYMSFVLDGAAELVNNTSAVVYSDEWLDNDNVIYPL